MIVSDASMMRWCHIICSHWSPIVSCWIHLASHWRHTMSYLRYNVLGQIWISCKHCYCHALVFFA